MYQIVDFITQQTVTPTNFIYTGAEHPWEIKMDLTAIRTKLAMNDFKITPPGLAKYLSWLPLTEQQNFISLQNSATPLIPNKSLGRYKNLFFKVEGKNPTGSFKDRGSALEIAVAKELGAKAIILASTGNMGASCACYAAVAKLPCFVLVPEGVPIAKLAQVIAFGGHIVQVKGSYNDAAELAQKIAASQGFYLAGDYAYRVEGQKTAAFEICDQLFFQAPDLVIVPIGCGTNIAAYAKGFSEYYQLGLIKKIPKLIGIQATGAAAVVASYQAGLSTITPLPQVTTVASAIAVPNPIDGIKALHAIYTTKGCALAVNDQEILSAQYQLSSTQGLFVESSAAATLAGLFKLSQQRGLRTKKIVCVLTGDGLKDPQIVLKTAINPPTIYPNEKEFLWLYQNNFFANSNYRF